MTIIKSGSRGPLVSFLQLTLKNANLYLGEIDGIFGPNTLRQIVLCCAYGSFCFRLYTQKPLAGKCVSADR